MESPLVDRLARASRSLISEAEKAAQEEIAELILLALVKEWDEAKHPRGAGGKFGNGGTPEERESRRIVDSEQPFGEITRAALTRSGKSWIEGANEDMILKAQTCADIAKGMTSSTKDLCVADGRLSPSDEMQEVGSKEVEDAIRAEAVSTLVRQWAETSNDDDSLSLAIQQAAAEEFGIKDHAEWTESSPQTMQMMKDTLSENGEVYKDFLRTQYNATQAEFAKQGIGPDDTLLLYRGTGLPLPDAGTKIDAQLRPLSSYSTDPMVAIKFASRASDTILATEVKVSDILSMPATGNGCLKEREMVILGGVKASTVVDAYESVETGKTVVEGLPDMASATKATKPTINVDNNLINSDWIKTGSWGFLDITDLASYASVNGVNLKATQMLSAQLQQAMALPSWIPAPQKLKDEAKEYIDKVTKSLLKEWDESKHPRGAGGRFGEGGGDQQNALIDSSGKVTSNGWDEWAYESVNINDALRGVDPTTDSEGNRLGPKEVEEYKKLANAIQEEASSTTLPFKEVWRGDSFNSTQELYDCYGNGKAASDDVVSARIELGGITSSSPDKGVADDYRATESSGPVSCLVCFSNPNGVVGTMTFPSITDVGVPWQKQNLSDLKMGESVLPEGAKYSARIFPPDTQTPYGTFDHYFVEAYSAAKSLAKEWDESKHPRGAGGRFGSGGADQSIQNSATAIQSSIERSLGSMPEDFFEDPNDLGGVHEYNTQARDASAAAIIEHLPEEAKDQVSKKEAVDVIDSWGVSANDTAQGLVIQDAAQKVFGLTDVAQADRTGKEEDIAYITKNFGGQVEAVLQAAYSATQERLAEVGLQPNDKISVYRGVDIPAVSKAEVGERLDFTQRALSSFTFEPSVAANFGDSVLRAEVAAKDIVSMPGTGLGFASLAEVVVKPSSDTILTKVDVGAGGIVTKAKGGTINLDHDEASAHWLHRMLAKTQKSLIDSLYRVAKERITVEIAAVEEEIDFIHKASLWAKQPQREYHEKLVRYYAPRLASALVRGVHGIPQAINEAKRQYEAAIGVVDKATGNAANASPARIAAASAATAGVKAQIKISPEDAKRVLDYLYGDAYMTGVHSAARQVGSNPIIPEALTGIEREIDWELWGPSESRAADIVRDGGLDVLLEDADVTIQGIFDTILDRLGNAIAYGLDNGLPSSQIADNISEVDPETGLSLVSNNAEMIASTTTSMAQSDATMDTYIENGIEQYWWLAEDSACDKPPGNNCRENMLDGPYDVSPLPDPQQPQHPNCRCTYLPVKLDAQGEITGPTPEDWQGGNADPGYIDYQANPEAIISLGTDATVGAEKSMGKEWDEVKHPRDDQGRFGSGGGDSFGVDSVASLTMERTDPWSLSGGSDAGERARDAHVIMRVQASEKLTGDEKKAVEIYTGKDYTRINGGLRGNGALGKQDAQVAKDLDTAIRYGSALSEETVLYRGITGGGGGLAGMKVGDTLLDNAFLSTTLDLRTAEDFMGPKIPSEGGYVMHITAPEGTRYLLGEPDELEVLLERGTALKVVGIDKTTTSFRGSLAPTVYAHVIG